MGTLDVARAGIAGDRRSLSWAGLIGALLAFMFIPAVVDVVVLDSPSTGDYPDQDSVNVLVLGKLVALVIVVVTITLLRWWPVVLHEQLRVRPWVWVIPVAFLGLSLALADYSRLTSAGLTLSLTLLLGTTLIATGEELLFRGVVLTFMRDRYRELTAALITSLLFGVSHLLGGPVHIVVSALFGYLMYYTRRVSGGVLVPIVVHGMYDFSVFSALTTSAPDDAGDASPALVLLTIVLIVVMVIARKRAELPATPATPAAPPQPAP